mgnify:CR=1 FL=1
MRGELATDLMLEMVLETDLRTMGSELVSLEPHGSRKQPDSVFATFPVIFREICCTASRICMHPVSFSSWGNSDAITSFADDDRTAVWRRGPIAEPTSWNIMNSGWARLPLHHRFSPHGSTFLGEPHLVSLLPVGLSCGFRAVFPFSL